MNKIITGICRMESSNHLNVLLISMFSCFLIYGQSPAYDSHWKLVWADDFNFLNTTIWEIANDLDHYGEPQMYRTDNVSVSNGNLILKVKRESYLEHNYTSGWVETKQAYNTRFGYIESRIKLPYGYGFWPAFWTFLGSGVSGSNAAEIDVFEMLGGGEFGSSTIMTTNLHTEYPDITDKFQSIAPTNFDYTSYHNYGIEWSPGKLIWYVDGFPVRVFVDHGIIDPVRIILNFAIQRDHLPNSSTPFPSDMLVDYVKVYQLKNDCNTITNTCQCNFSKVIKQIIIGEGCLNAIPNNTKWNSNQW